MYFTIRVTTQLGKVFDAFCAKLGPRFTYAGPAEMTALEFEGERLRRSDTPGSAGIEDGDQLDFVEHAMTDKLKKRQQRSALSPTEAALTASSSAVPQQQQRTRQQQQQAQQQQQQAQQQQQQTQQQQRTVSESTSTAQPPASPTAPLVSCEIPNGTRPGSKIRVQYNNNYYDLTCPADAVPGTRRTFRLMESDRVVTFAEKMRLQREAARKAKDAKDLKALQMWRTRVNAFLTETADFAGPSVRNEATEALYHGLFTAVEDLRKVRQGLNTLFVVCSCSPHLLQLAVGADFARIWCSHAP